MRVMEAWVAADDDAEAMIIGGRPGSVARRDDDLPLLLFGGVGTVIMG